MNVTVEKKRHAVTRSASKGTQTRQPSKPSRQTVSSMRDALAGRGLKTFSNMQSLMTHIGL